MWSSIVGIVVLVSNRNISEAKNSSLTLHSQTCFGDHLSTETISGGFISLLFGLAACGKVDSDLGVGYVCDEAFVQHATH